MPLQCPPTRLCSLLFSLGTSSKRSSLQGGITINNMKRFPWNIKVQNDSDTSRTTTTTKQNRQCVWSGMAVFGNTQKRKEENNAKTICQSTKKRPCGVSWSLKGTQKWLPDNEEISTLTRESESGESLGEIRRNVNWFQNQPRVVLKRIICWNLSQSPG